MQIFYKIVKIVNILVNYHIFIDCNELLDICRLTLDIQQNKNSQKKKDLVYNATCCSTHNYF